MATTTEIGKEISASDSAVPASASAHSSAASKQDTKDVVRQFLQSQSGHRDGRSNLALIFKDLTISAPDTGPATVKTLPRAVLNTFGPDQLAFIRGLVGWKPKTPSLNILSGVTGILKPGEMLFVLGRPGSGCSTFLRAAANQSASTLSISGDLNFSGIPHNVFKTKHQRETIYLPEEDRHIASLSVAQTLRFALKMSIPSDFNGDLDELVTTVAKMFGLEHALSTPVGGPYSPGVSGGEKKRVSIAEVLAAGSSVQCFDNSTSGLDSATALDFVEALRQLTDVGQKTTLATLYQAGQGIYDAFDKVLLLSEGRQVFFGPTGEAEGYLRGLGYLKIPGQTTAEFLVTVTDPAQRTFEPGSPAASIVTSEDLARAFRASDRYQALVDEIAWYEASTPAPSLSTTSYNLSFSRQVWECLHREYQLVSAQRMVYYIKWATTVILSLVIGSEYFNLTADAAGAFPRSGILFYSLIFNGWLQFPELFDAHTNRPVLERQGKNFPLCLPLLKLLGISC
jgi:ABC-type multidrug transport system ATPase subunit